MLKLKKNLSTTYFLDFSQVLNSLKPKNLKPKKHTFASPVCN